MATSANPDVAARAMTPQEVFDAAAPYVPGVVECIISRVPRAARLRDDMTQEGMLELWKVCAKFDPNQSADIEAFATARVRYALIDYLCRSRGESGLTGRQIRSRVAVGLEAPECFSYHDRDLRHGSAAALASRDPEHTDGPAKELLAAIRRTHAGLTPAEEQAVASYFADGLLMREAAGRQGVSERRISQLVNNAIVRIRRAMLDSGRTCLN